MKDGEYGLRLLAEECCELAQAALKVVRARHPGETPQAPEDAGRALVEEMADVYVMLDHVYAQLSREDREAMWEIMRAKRERWRRRDGHGQGD